MIDVDNPVIEFTAASRCDGCGARALAVAEREGSPELLFCGHHLRDHRARLISEGWSLTYDPDSDYQDYGATFAYAGPV